ncbi:MAG: hypothetical protein EA367_09750 [Leptolyngbya sp. DLM2.Bin15]|nr:MAG: hypothetical protein EA367_09750 [Leptolyngbya sp. DLM2.Bin15]
MPLFNKADILSKGWIEKAIACTISDRETKSVKPKFRSLASKIKQASEAIACNLGLFYRQWRQWQGNACAIPCIVQVDSF